MNDYIFGYGSLINEESRSKTGKSGKALPVKVRGIQRQWSLVVPNYSMTALGAIHDKESICNGVIIPISTEEMQKFDDRELPYGYSRISLEKESISMIKSNELPNGRFWVYVSDNPGFPSNESPIVQSYLDVIMQGCLTFGEKFANEFILTTRNWNYLWINDRKNPRYPRAISNVHNKNIIDRILEETIPDIFKNRI